MPDDPAISIHAIHFCHPQAKDAVALREPRGDTFLGATPEWVAGGRSEPAAFPRGTRPTIAVTFRRQSPDGAARGPWTIGAVAPDGRVAVGDRSVALEFGASGLSAPVPFELAHSVGETIGTRQVHWNWRIRRDDGDIAIGRSAHPVHVVWRRALDAAAWSRPVYAKYQAPSPPPPVPDWTYEPLVAWSCEWAHGATDEKQICDRLIAHARQSGLEYYRSAWDVRTMLLQGGGMCGGWYKLFQGLAAAQGVRVERRSYSVDWREFPGREARWCAIVVRAPGINRAMPVEASSAFHDADRAGGAGVAVQNVTERRYRFWGKPGSIHDGHCINLLHHDGRWYLYDVCFLDHAVELDGFTPPPGDRHTHVPANRDDPFRRAYLDRAVDFMLGSLTANGAHYESRHCQYDNLVAHHTPCVTTNGLSVRTAAIPDDGPGITFIWGP